MEATYWFMFPIAIIIAAVANSAGIGGGDLLFSRSC